MAYLKLLTLALVFGLSSCSDGAPPAPDPDPDPDPTPGSTDPAVGRGSAFFGSSEKFNRYYTAPNWVPIRTLYVSGSGTNTDAGSNSAQSPAPVNSIVDMILPGDMVIFLQTGGAYNNINIQIPEEKSGQYDAPIVFVSGEGSAFGAHLRCSSGGSNAASSCFNLEGANYIAINGFEMSGGSYGVRAVGLGYAGPQHQIGIAVLNNKVHDQSKDPIFSGQSDWMVVEGNEAYNAGNGDGHGIYLSNGSDWGIVRQNELYQNASSDLQINADPMFTCLDEGISYFDTRCDGSANSGLGQGVSEFFLITENFFHHGDGNGPNFTSVRNSEVSHNIFGPYERHNTSFWQETDNPALGSSNNIIKDNLFVGYREHLLQLVEDADANTVTGNILLALNTTATAAALSIVNIEVGANSGGTFSQNIYIGGYTDGYTILSSEDERNDYDPAWFGNIGFGRINHPEDWTPVGSAPFGLFHGWEPPVISP